MFLIEETNSLAPYQFVITDTFNVVLNLLNIPGIDFEGSETGIIRIWGISYTGELLVREGDTLTTTTLSSDCASLSENYIEVEKVDSGPTCGL